jgi:hypothetical protein
MQRERERERSKDITETQGKSQRLRFPEIEWMRCP